STLPQPAPDPPRSRTMSRVLFAGCVVAFVLSAAQAADPDANWPHWRGPTADGSAAPTADPPVNWAAATNIKWKTPLPGRASATPIVWGDKVFVLTAVKTD